MADKKKVPLKEFTEQATYEVPVHRMTDDALREFVVGFCDGRIFTSNHLSDPSLLPNVFLPVALGLFRHHTDEEIKQKSEEIGIFWEWMSEAGPLAVNGNPTFFSLRIMHVKDWERARTAIQAEIARRRQIDIPPEDENE